MQDRVRWDDVRLFLGAYEHKSLGLAAKRLGIDTSTMSRRIAALERDLGTRLFERTREGLVPTRAADGLVDAAQAMRVAHARIARETASDLDVAEGTVRVSADPGTAELVVAPALVRLRALHPAITIELDTSTRPLDLARREADIAIRSVNPRGAEIVVTKIGEERWQPFAAPELARTIGRARSWNGVPWIAWDADWASFAPARWLAHHAPRAPIALRTSHIGSQLAAANAGLGALLLPPTFARARGLVGVRHATVLAASAAQSPRATVWLAGHRALRDVPRIGAVWDFLRTELRRRFAPH